MLVPAPAGLRGRELLCQHPPSLAGCERLRRLSCKGAVHRRGVSTPFCAPGSPSCGPSRSVAPPLVVHVLTTQCGLTPGVDYRLWVFLAEVSAGGLGSGAGFLFPRFSKARFKGFCSRWNYSPAMDWPRRAVGLQTGRHLWVLIALGIHLLKARPSEDQNCLSAVAVAGACGVGGLRALAMSSRTENTEKGGSAQVRRPGDCWCRRHGPRRRLRSRRGPIASRVHAPRRWHTRAPPRDALGSHLHQSVCTSGPYVLSIVGLFGPEGAYRSANRTCTTARDGAGLARQCAETAQAGGRHPGWASAGV